jgi:hypothetical protein
MPVPPPAVATNRPTPQYQRHHDVTAPQIDGRAFQPAWRVSARLDQLLASGKIEPDQHEAACKWRRWTEQTAPLRAQPWDIRVDHPVTANDAAMLHRITAAARLRACAAALGELRTRLLHCCLIDDRSWRDIAGLLRCIDKTARDRLIEAIAALADHLAGRAVAAPPVIRYRIEPGRQ